MARQWTGEGEEVGGRSPVDAVPAFGFADTKLLDLLPHPSFVVTVERDDSFRFVYANPAYRRGCSGTPMSPGWAAGWCCRRTPLSRTCARSRGRRANTGRSVSRRSGAAQHRARTVAVDVTPIVDDDGRCRHLVGAAREVTEHRNLENELRTHASRSAHRAAEPGHARRVARRRDPPDGGGPVGRARALGRRPLQDRERQPRTDVGDELLAVMARRVDRVLRSVTSSRAPRR